MITPTICTIVASRNAQSSVSYAEANQEKLIHAQQIAKIAKPKAVSPAAKWPSASKCANCSPATPNATTKVRSYNSSSGVAARCRSFGSRPDITCKRCARDSSYVVIGPPIG